jgi:uncharacterized membrane protein YhaH (DUF805 family)
MFGSIRYNLTHLFDFRGRDARQTFWYYVLFLVALYVVATIIAIVPIIGSAMQQAMKAAQAGVPQEQMSAQIVQSMGPGIASIAWLSIGASLLFTLLMLAAFVRRLHDSGNPGWWAGVVLAIKLGTLAVGIQNMGRVDEAMQALGDPAKLQQLQAATQGPGQALITLLGWAGPLIVVVFGVFQSTPGPNRYGDAPVVF